MAFVCNVVGICRASVVFGVFVPSKLLPRGGENDVFFVDFNQFFSHSCLLLFCNKHKSCVLLLTYILDGCII